MPPLGTSPVRGSRKNSRRRDVSLPCPERSRGISQIDFGCLVFTPPLCRASYEQNGFSAKRKRNAAVRRTRNAGEEFGVSRFAVFLPLSGIKAGELSLHTFFPSTERKYEVFISYLLSPAEVSFLPLMIDIAVNTADTPIPANTIQSYLPFVAISSIFDVSPSAPPSPIPSESHNGSGLRLP